MGDKLRSTIGKKKGGSPLTHLSESLLWQLPGIIGFKDKDSVFLGCNKNAANITGFSSMDDYVGRTDYELRCDAVKSAKIFRSHDRIAMKEGKSITLEIHRYGDQRIHAFLVNKSAIFNNSGCLFGTSFNGIDATSILSMDIGKLMLEDYRRFYGNKHCIAQVQSVGCASFDIKLTRRESECIFYLIRGKTAKEIAAILSRGQRTIETHLENLKKKFGVNTKSALIDAAIASGYMNHFPEHFLFKIK